MLQRRPPPVDKSEKSLPLIVKHTLSQLRSGFCARLKSYQFRIGRADDDLCSECGLHPHETTHLFDCPARPTTLSVESLWSEPREAALFLKSMRSFDFFPDIGPPPPSRRRRRARPPADPPPAPTSPLSSPVFTPATLPPSPFFPILRPRGVLL